MNQTSERRLAFKRHAHAFGHLLESPAPCDVALCPLCLGPFGEDQIVSVSGQPPEVTIEHAPPRQRTRVGLPRAACLAHRRCNNANGYEARSGRYRHELIRLARGEEARLHGLIDGQESLVHLIRDANGLRPIDPASWGKDIRIPVSLPLDAQLTELKAAYLVAFVALGYSWATTEALDQVRSVIRSGDISALGQAPLFVVREPDPEMANSVIVSEESQAVLVIGDDPRFGAMLPLAESRPIPAYGSSTMCIGEGVPWLAHRWWLKADALAFRWDCAVARPMWRVEADELVG